MTPAGMKYHKSATMKLHCWSNLACTCNQSFHSSQSSICDLFTARFVYMRHPIVFKDTFLRRLSNWNLSWHCTFVDIHYTPENWRRDLPRKFSIWSCSSWSSVPLVHSCWHNDYVHNDNLIVHISLHISMSFPHLKVLPSRHLHVSIVRTCVYSAYTNGTK